MRLIVKFNLILLIVFAIGMTIASLVSYQVTKENAYLQVKGKDEISSLAASFNRMMRSTSMMAKMLRNQQTGS